MRLDRPFRATDAIAAGLVTAQQLRGPRFRTLSRGIHVLADTPADVEQTARAALLRHPGATVVGTAAAVLLGAVDTDVTDRDGPVELAVLAGARPAPGLLLRRDRLGADETVEQDGMRLSSPVRTAFDVGRRLGTVHAVMIVEALGRAYPVTVDAVREVVGRHPHERGLVQLRTALAHVEPAARAAGLAGPAVRVALRSGRRDRVGHGGTAADPRLGRRGRRS